MQAPRWSPVATTAGRRRAACPPALPVRAAASEVRRTLPSLVRVPVILVLFSLGGNAEARQLCAWAALCMRRGSVRGHEEDEQW